MSDYQRRSWIIRPTEPGVLVPARVAAVLTSAIDFHALTQRAVRDPMVYDVLLSLHEASREHRGSGSGSAVESKAESAPRSKEKVQDTLTTSQAAQLIGISDRAVRKATKEERLPAEWDGHQAWIKKSDALKYKAKREAA